MTLKGINLEEKLYRLKRKQKNEKSILDEVKAILKKDNERDIEILKTLKNPNSGKNNLFDFDLLESDRIYHVDQIKKICVDYRLRFLDTQFFKGDLPYEAISKIKELEKQHQIKIDSYKIMAPSKLFRLEHYDDPLLFAPIGNGYYYLIHKWGNDLSPYRKLLAWPFKTFESFALSIFILSMLLTAAIPNGTFSAQTSSANAGIVFLFMFKSVFAAVMYYGYLAGKNFSSSVWDSKYCH